MQCTPPEVAVEANEAVLCLRLTKSRDNYSLAYQHIIEWGIGQYLKLRCCLKKASEGYSAKKSRVFTKEQVEGFLMNGPDKEHLGMKIVLLIGVTGACRCDEMIKMNIDDIEDMGNLILIKIPDSKTRKVRSFTIMGEMYIKIYRKYASLRTRDMQEKRCLLRYQNGKCFRSVMGIHTISAVPRKVAEFLMLNHVQEYTGHCLMRTSATLLIDGGGNIDSLKRHEGWTSTSVAEGYIEESIRNKNENAARILNLSETVTTKTDVGNQISSSPKSTNVSESISSLDGFNFENATITNCTFNITLNR